MTPQQNPKQIAVLTALVEQAVAEGSSPLTLKAVVEEASQTGAARALARLGLEDSAAGADIRELRQLMIAWRDLRGTARRAAIGWLVKIAITALLIGIIVQVKGAKFLNSIIG